MGFETGRIKFKKLFEYDHGVLPMGFETFFSFLLSKTIFPIMEYSLWDLKQKLFNTHKYLDGIMEYSLWDLKPDIRTLL